MRHAHTPWRTVLLGCLLLLSAVPILPAAMAQQAPAPDPAPAPPTTVTTPETVEPVEPVSPVTPVAPVAPEEPVPDAVTVLKRAIAAHKALGPTTIVTTLSGMSDGQPMTITVTSRRNDAIHYVATARARMGLVTLEEGVWQWYRSGAKQFFYDASDNVFYRSVEAGPFPPDLMTAFLGEIDPAQLASRKGPDNAGIRVTPAEVNGVPAWEVMVPEAAAPGGKAPNSPASRMVFGRADALIRGFRFADGGEALDVTVTYTPAETPFPASAFVFTPPAGAKEVKPAKPAAKAPAKKAPAKKAPAKKAPVKKAPPSRLPRR